MLKTVTRTAFLAAFISVHFATGASADGTAILRRVDEIRSPSSGFSFKVDVQTSEGAEIGLSVAVRDHTKALVQYVSPVKIAGRKLLYLGPNMWVYIPGSRRALRISPRQRLLGGVSSAEVARMVYSFDYGVSGISGAGDTQVLHLKAKGKGVPYGRIDLTVNSAAEPKVAVLFTSNGERKLKTIYFEGYASVLGALRPTRLRVVDHMENNAVTAMTYHSHERTSVPEAWFQPTYLSRF